MKVFKEEMSKDEKLMSIKAFYINAMHNFQNYRKFSTHILDCLYDAGILDNNYNSILLQETLTRIENCKSVFIILIVKKDKGYITVSPSSIKKLKPLLGSKNVKDNGIAIGAIYEDDDGCPTTFFNERILRGEHLGTILNTALGKQVMERCGYSRKDTENKQKED